MHLPLQGPRGQGEAASEETRSLGQAGGATAWRELEAGVPMDLQEIAQKWNRVA